jgi:hypothetical protein
MTGVRHGRVTAGWLAVLFAVTGWAAPAAGQDGSDIRVWTMVSARGRAGTESPWRWATDSLVGTKGGVRTVDVLIGQVTVTNDVTDRSSVGIGYAYGAAFSSKGTRREHRLVQQFKWRPGASSRVSFKSVVEERFITGRDPALRASQSVRATLPLLEHRHLAAVVSNQTFVQWNRAPAAARGLENAAFVGLALGLAPRRVVEVGYLNLYSSGGSRGPTWGHVMSMAVTVSR